MFTVVIPLYNKKPYIRRSVESVLQQTFTDFELFVIDDGSTDGGIDELAGISDDRLCLIQQMNSGKGEARNAGIRKATREWIAFIDADDMWFSTHLQELKRIIDAHPNVGLISTNYLECNTESIIPELPNASTSIEEIDYFIKASTKIGIVFTSSAAVRSSVAKKMGGFKRFKAGEDLEFWARIALEYSVAISSAITAVYFRGTDGVMESLCYRVNNETRQMSLSEISPSVAFLVDCLDEPKYSNKRNSIVTYINSRVYSCVRGELYHGNVTGAKSVVKLMIAPLPFRLRVLTYGLLLPDSWIKIPLAIFRMIKSIKN